MSGGMSFAWSGVVRVARCDAPQSGALESNAGSATSPSRLGNALRATRNAALSEAIVDALRARPLGVSAIVAEHVR